MVVYWDTRWRLGAARIKPWLIAGLVLGFSAVLLMHNTDLIGKLTGRLLPVNQDPLHRVREWSDVARVIGEARQELLAEGKPVFIIGDHYGLVGVISFYLPGSQDQRDDRAAGVCPTQPGPAQPVLLLARLRKPPRPKCHLRPRVGP